MIALYKDPKGENVFESYNTPGLSFNSQQQCTQLQLQQHTDAAMVDTLKKRIQELENIVARSTNN